MRLSVKGRPRAALQIQPDRLEAMSNRQKKLLWWSVALMALALIAQRVPMGHKAATTIGLVEVLLAIGTGIAFGIAVSDREQ